MQLKKSNISLRTDVSRETSVRVARVVSSKDNERGASILIALFYFLVCALVGGVVLTAATVTTGQLVALEKSQQAYYSTTSAAELLRDAIVGGTCTASGSGTDAVWTCTLSAQEGSSTGSTGSTSGTSSASPSNTLSAQLARAAKSIASSAVSTGAQVTWNNVAITFTTSDAAGNANDVPAVTAKIVMRSDCSLHITLTPTDYTEDVGNYQVICDIPAALLYKEDGVTIEKITWQNAIISKPISQAGTTQGGN